MLNDLGGSLVFNPSSHGCRRSLPLPLALQLLTGGARDAGSAAMLPREHGRKELAKPRPMLG